VTALFLRPIYKVLGEGGAVVHESAGYKSLQKTKWLTLMGSTLAVLSSSALYINMGLFVILGDRGKPFYTNPYLSYAVFGMNLDSVMNDVGILVVCGVLKTVSCADLTKVFSTAQSVYKVRPVPQPHLQPAGAYTDPSVVFASQGDDQMD
jgi:hypothetical protein